MIERLKNIFKKKTSAPTEKVKLAKRSFVGAKTNRFTNWINATFSKVNADIRRDLITTQTRCRELAKNDPIVRSYLTLTEKGVIGKCGFVLQSQIKSSETELDEKLNSEIEWAWYDYGSVNGGLSMTRRNDSQRP